MYYVRMQLLDRPHHNFMMVPVSPEGFITLIVLRRYFNGAIGVHFYNIYRELVTVTKVTNNAGHVRFFLPDKFIQYQVSVSLPNNDMYMNMHTNMHSNVHQSMPIDMHMNMHELQKVNNEMVTLKSEIKLICSKLNVLTKSVMLHTESRNMTVTASPGVQREHGQAERDSDVKVLEEKAQSDPVVDTLEPKSDVVGRKTKTSWNHDGLDKDGKGRMEPLMDVSVIKMETCMDSYKGNIETCMDSYSGNAVDRTTEFKQDTQLVCVDSRTEQLSSGSVILSSKVNTVTKQRKGSGQWEETCAGGHTLEDGRTQYRNTGLRKPGENSLKTDDNGLMKSVNTLNINVSLNSDAQEALNCVKNKEIKIENICINNTGCPMKLETSTLNAKFSTMFGLTIFTI